MDLSIFSHWFSMIFPGYHHVFSPVATATPGCHQGGSGKYLQDHERRLPEGAFALRKGAENMKEKHIENRWCNDVIIYIYIYIYIFNTYMLYDIYIYILFIQLKLSIIIFTFIRIYSHLFTMIGRDVSPGICTHGSYPNGVISVCTA